MSAHELDDVDVVTDHPTPHFPPVSATGITREAHISWA